MELYIIVKVIYGCNYWWNEEKRSWQGLRSNATPMDQSEMNNRWEWLKRNDKEDQITFKKW